MKKVAVFLLLLLLTASCKNASTVNTSGEDYVFGMDFQKNFHSGHGGITACESESGFLFIKNFFLYYIEKSSMQTTIVCTKLECLHNDNKCNAFVPSDQLTYYDNKLYYLEYGSSGNIIISMDLDGSNRKNLFSYINERSSYDYLIHRGYAYFVEDLCLYSVQLNNTNRRAKVYEFSDSYYFNLWGDGDYVFICAENLNFSEEFYRYDLSSAKCEKVWSVNSINEDWMTKGKLVNGWYISNGVIYYYLSGNGIWKHDFDSQEYSKIADISDPSQCGHDGYASFDENGIYIDSSSSLNQQDPSKYAIHIYDYQGVLTDTIPIGDIYNERELTYFYCLYNGSKTLAFQAKPLGQLAR